MVVSYDLACPLHRFTSKYFQVSLILADNGYSCAVHVLSSLKYYYVAAVARSDLLLNKL